ncbi:nuclear transport factor 2 family protein [Mycolicibacterium smegmatis]|uniref:nuclear transport factor 2 family protein n=1 Tax=Mycolicibacterium smegmatis TaxID=1772 RepID=UPI001E4E396B|nr:nuclear transport factor 2 family protein [Mycolicibacterium smegmatis]UGT73045.1 nuclear transport factor 2 family protein [Mycolicibacterium smegmatis]
MPESATLEDRLRTIEDTLAIYGLLATHPISADTGEPELIEGIYTEDFVFDRGPGLAGAQGVSAMVDLVGNAAHHAAIAGGLAHFGSLPLIELDGDTATATSYLALITPDHDGAERELPNHGSSTGFRIHRVLANRWSFTRADGRWRISKRTVLPMDGSGPALDDVVRKAKPFSSIRNNCP